MSPLTRSPSPLGPDPAFAARGIVSESMDGFEGRGAVVTGGASGIGFATAPEFAPRGARDVRHLEEMVHLADEAFRLLGQVDIVFSNAGIVVAGPLVSMTHEDWRWVI